MNNYCKYLKKRKNKPYCNIIRKETTLSRCRECDNKEYKTKNERISSYKNINAQCNTKKSAKSTEKSTEMHCKSTKSNSSQIRNSAYSLHHSAETLHKMKNKSKKLAKLERDRFSVFTDDDKCFVCDSTYQLTWHEIYAGRNRRNSMIYGFCLRMCLTCHEEKQEDIKFNEFWHRQAQLYWEENIGTRDEFLSMFRRNYLE